MGLLKRLSRAAVATALLATLFASPSAAMGAEEADVHLMSLSRTTSDQVGVGDTVSFTYETSEPSSQSWATFTFYDEYDRYHELSGENGVVQAVVKQGWKPGVHELTSVSFSTQSTGAVRSSIYTREGEVTYYPGDRPSEHSFDFSLLDFEVDNPNPDVRPPQLISVTNGNGSSFTVGDEIRINYEAVEEASISSIHMYFKDPSGRTRRIAEDDYEGLNGWASGTVQQNWEPGSYTLVAVSLYDDTGNGITYAGNGEYHTGYESGTHDVDFSGVIVEIDNPDPDLLAPRLTGIEKLDETYFPGETLVLTYTWEEEFELGTIYFSFNRGNNYGRTWMQTRDPIWGGSPDGVPDGSLELSVDESWVFGKYELGEVGIRDMAGNGRSYWRSGFFYGESESGPHDVPFTNGDFQVALWPYEFADSSEIGSIFIDFESGKFRFMPSEENEAPVRRSAVKELPNGLFSAEYEDEDFLLKGIFDPATGRFVATISADGQIYPLANTDGLPAIPDALPASALPPILLPGS